MSKNKLSLENIQSQINYWEMVKRVWLRSEPLKSDDINTLVYKLYLHTNTVKSITDWINENNFRTIGNSGNERKFTTNDISYIIQNADIQDKDLQNIVRDIFFDNKALSLKIHG